MEYTSIEHQPTKNLIRNLNKDSIQKYKEFSNEGILFVPSFEKLSNAFPAPESFLFLYSLEKNKMVYISSIKINGITRGYYSNIEIKKNINLNKEIKDIGIYYASLPLFTEKNIDMEQISKEDEIELTLTFGFSDDIKDFKEMTFYLVRVKIKDIAWAT